MIFLGDICYPFGSSVRIEELERIFTEPVVANLEGPIIKSDAVIRNNKKVIKLYCSRDVISFLKLLNVSLVSLANNHIFDAGMDISLTVDELNSNGIKSCGAGNNLNESSEWVKINYRNNDYVFLSFGWKPIECIPAGIKSPGVNPLNPKHVLNSIAKVRRSEPNADIVLLMHWNYALEEYPQPAHRQLAFKAIDEGVSAVIGHHPHCVQGIEIYKNKPVVYSLGNWFLPQTDYFGKQLKHPEIVRKQYAVKWSSDSDDIIVYWFDFNPDNNDIRFLGEESIYDSKGIKELTPFNNLNHKDYYKWFRKNRVKRKILPIYNNYYDYRRNMLFDNYIVFRHKFVNAIKKIK